MWRPGKRQTWEHSLCLGKSITEKIDSSLIYRFNCLLVLIQSNWSHALGAVIPSQIKLVVLWSFKSNDAESTWRSIFSSLKFSVRYIFIEILRLCAFHIQITLRSTLNRGFKHLLNVVRVICLAIDSALSSDSLTPQWRLKETTLCWCRRWPRRGSGHCSSPEDSRLHQHRPRKNWAIG